MTIERLRRPTRRSPRLYSGAMKAASRLNVGHALAFRSDKLGFLLRCARQADVVELKLGRVRTYLLNDPADIRHVLVTEEPRFPKNPRLVEAADPALFGEGLVGSSETDHRSKRLSASAGVRPAEAPGARRRRRGLRGRAAGRLGVPRRLRRRRPSPLRSRTGCGCACCSETAQTTSPTSSSARSRRARSTSVRCSSPPCRTRIGFRRARGAGIDVRRKISSGCSSG